MPIDPRTPVIVGVGQAGPARRRPERRRRAVDLLADAARGDARRRRRDPRPSTRSRSSTCISWRYPDPGRAPRPSPRDRAPHDDPHHDRRQQPADAREPARGRDPRGRARRRPARRRRVHVPRRRARRIDPKAWLDWTQPDDPPCPNVVGDARPGIEPVRDGPPRARADAGVPALRDRTPRRGRSRRRRAPARRRTSCGRTSPRSRPATRTPGRRTPYTADEIRVRSPENRLVTLPVHEADVRQHRRRPGRRVRPVLLRGRARRGGPRRPDGVPRRRRRRARPLLLHRAGVARRVAPRSASRDGPRSTPPGSRSTTSPGFDLYSCFPSAVQLAIGVARARGTRRAATTAAHA